MKIKKLIEFINNNDIPKKKIILDQLQYRVPMIPTEYVIESGEYVYYICPRCDAIIDMEYVSYCCVCGQALKWWGVGKAKLRKPEWYETHY